jgi:nicotinate-nucleotide adenylyltransferase
VGQLKRRVGIFAGTFDPVHVGHITFALQAIEEADLDHVLFVPERRPRGKLAPEHFGHRVAMIRHCLQPHSKLAVLEVDEPNLTVNRSLPHLYAATDDADLVLLVGSDVVDEMIGWPDIDRLLSQISLVVGVRGGESAEAVELQVASWAVQPRDLTIFESFAPEVSSGAIRDGLRTGRSAAGVLDSVRRYSRENWLYVSIPN